MSEKVRPRQDRRRGQSLILMFFVFLALIGVLALTLDFGFVMLSRRQMQTGVNTAAIEGLRGRGLANFDANNETLRRNNARNILQLTYDDDFDLSTNNTTVGAGIDSSLIQGNGFQSTTIGPANTTLSENLANRANFIFRPNNFQLNAANLDHGDMLVGRYQSNAVHSEDAAYLRPDFDPTGTTAFLIRMRRTHNPAGLDEVTDVSSRGGGLPLMLARMSFLRAEDASAPYSIRRDGVTVRATAIADSVPARSVGVSNMTLAPPIVGAAPISISLADWQALTVNTSYDLSRTNGDLLTGTTVVANTRRVLANQPLFACQTQASIEQAWPEPNLLADGTNAEFYAAIFNTTTSATTRVSEDLLIGFVRIQLNRTGANYTLTPLPQITAAENAVSLPAIGWQQAVRTQLQSNATFAALNNADQTVALAELITIAFQQSDSLAINDNGLLTPALVRAIR
ncbi:MAG: hypothetical protein CMJ78_19715 [Planctomycetaceae bacterium]|nr:hypothetical protein [Planctomycetaceae bacterium]